MKTTIKNFLYTTLFIFILISCGKKTADVLIPEDAAVVVHLNMESLTSKLSWEEIKNSDWFKMASEEGHHSDIQKRLLANPDSSGVDLKKDLYMFVQMRGTNSYVVLQGKLKDAKAFETMVASMDDKPQEIKKQGSFSYAGDDEGAVTWTSDRFIIVGNGNMGPRQEMFGNNTPKAKISIDSILRYAKDLYSLPQKNSITNDSHYASIAAEKGDIHLWLSSGSLIKNSMPGEMSMFKAASLLDGNVTGYTVNFDNGKITANTKTWFNNEVGALMKKYQPANLNTEMLKRIQGQNMSVVFAMNYPPEGLKEFLKLFGVDGMVNGFLGDVGLSLDDFVKANKGDVLFAVSDLTVEDKEMNLKPGKGDLPSSMPKPGANILFATSINDKPSFDKMVDVLKTEVSKQGGAADLSMIKYTIKDNWFIAGNAQESVDGFASGNTTDHPFISKISGHPVGGFIDFQKLSGGIKSKQFGGMSNIFAGDSTKVWDNMIFYGGEMKDGATVAYMEVNMFDKTTNSLKQINNFMSIAAKKAKEQNNSYAPGLVDTTSVRPPGLTQ